LTRHTHEKPCGAAWNVFRVELTHQAEKSLEGVLRSDRSLNERFIKAFDVMAKGPSQGKPLRGRLRGVFSYRLGSDRILYETHRRRLIVVAIDLGHRKEIYE
jgi:mRNA interferase RelE/StbE